MQELSRQSSELPDVTWDTHNDTIPQHISPNQVTTFLRCPEEWRQRYVLENQGRIGGGLLRGSAFHEAVAYTVENTREHGELPDLGEILDVAAEAYEQDLDEKGGPGEVDWTDEGDLPPGEAKLESERKKDETILFTKAYVPRLQELDLSSAFSEVPVNTLVDGIPFIGFVDIILNARSILEPGRGSAAQDETVIVEPKTSASNHKTAQPHHIFQVGLYADMLGIPGTVDVVRTLKSGPDVCVNPLTWPRGTDSRLEIVASTGAWIQTLMRHPGPDAAWPMTGSQHLWACKTCPASETCPGAATRTV